LSLLESEERFQQMARNIQEIFWMIDADTKQALFVNQSYERSRAAPASRYETAPLLMKS
jgi:hypothetical protein